MRFNALRTLAGAGLERRRHAARSASCSGRRCTASSASSRWTCSGMAGLVADAPYELTARAALFLYSRADTIYGGSNQIQRNIIGERALGLPRGARDVPDAPPYVPAHGLLAGKTVLVTAAAGTGIGFATAKRCVEEGAPVVISDVHERRLGEAAEQLAEIRREAAGRAVRRHRRGGGAGAVRRGATQHGQLDVLVNNAGLGGTADARRHDRRAVDVGARRHAERHDALHARRAPPHAARDGAARSSTTRRWSAGGRRRARRTTRRPRPA